MPHFLAHALPIHQALPDGIRGDLWAAGRAYQRAKELGIEAIQGTPTPRHLKEMDLIMTASFEDYRRMNPNYVILVNHGAGQRYTGDNRSATHPSYSGGEHRERVVLFLSPSEQDAEVCRRDGQKAVAVGVPKLDTYHLRSGSVGSGPAWLGLVGLGSVRRGEVPTVCVSWHADAHVCPESRSAFGFYREELVRLARMKDELPFRLVGHGHPRWGAHMERFWTRLGIPFFRHFDQALEQADLYVIDNSSTGPEFASTGRPIVWMSAPYYRRNVHHGGRFWNWVKGMPHVEEPDQLLPTIECALADPPVFRRARQRMVEEAYGSLCDGQATSRAVASIVELCRG